MPWHSIYMVVMPLLALISVVHSQSAGCTSLRGTPGQCISIRDCPSIRNALSQIRPGSSDATALRRAICKLENNVFFVCCPIEEPESILPSTCGVRTLGDRIINGEAAKLGTWPWMALLESTGADGRLALVCGGVLISERYVLTAAHCVNTSDFTLRSVRLGEHTINTNPDCDGVKCFPPYQSIPVEETTIHEQYGLPFGCRNCNDIALLRLDRRVDFANLNIAPICLPQNLEEDLGITQRNLTSNSLHGWVAGWGTTEPNRPRPANVLQQVNLPLNDELCSIDLRVFPDRRMALCAGGEQRDTCQGDSGGPMVIGNTKETKFYLLGIVSRGPLICGAANSAGLYTNVNHYMPWILEKLRP